MRFIPLTLLAATAIPVSAQNWCPPGATWTYDSHGFVMLQNGYTTLAYTNDTVLAGLTGEVMRGMTVGTDFGMTDIDTMWTDAVTRHDGPVVYTWSNGDQAWDTLYNFAAVPGESWQPPFAQPNLCGGAEYGDAVQVLDTGTVVVAGMPLRYLDIHNGFYDGRIVERLGFSLGMWLFEGCWAPECICGLRCYHDNEIEYVRSDLTTPCESVGGIITDITVPESASLALFPNPGTDHFTLSLPPGPHNITLFDAMGRMAARERMSGERATIGTAHLPPGIYAVRVDEGSARMRWVKQ